MVVEKEHGENYPSLMRSSDSLRRKLMELVKEKMPTGPHLSSPSEESKEDSNGDGKRKQQLCEHS